MKKKFLTLAICALGTAMVFALAGCGANLDRDVTIQNMSLTFLRIGGKSQVIPTAIRAAIFGLKMLTKIMMKMCLTPSTLPIKK